MIHVLSLIYLSFLFFLSLLFKYSALYMDHTHIKKKKRGIGKTTL